MLTFTQAILLGLLQGVTELFPVSSLGHSVLLPSILHWNIDESSDAFLSFVVATHLATAIVLFFFFGREWVEIIKGTFRSLLQRRIDPKDTPAKLGWLIVVSTVPAGILGLLLQSAVQKLFSAPEMIAGILVANGVVLYAAEALRARAPKEGADDRRLAHLTYLQALGIGLAQSVALIPGFSRTGLAMTGGLVDGLSHENAARYAFLLSTPIIAAAAILKVPDLFQGGSQLPAALIGAVAAALASYFSVKYLTRYFQTQTLKPFAIYCALAGVVSLIILIG